MTASEQPAAFERELRFPWLALVLALAVALAGRVLLLVSGRLSFHSDEAVIGLMARHILEGARPTFFYGQAYMGSLDAWLVALGFSALGESVLSIRVVQAALFLAVVAAGFGAAWRLSRRTVVALVCGLTLAVPPVLAAVYTSATLGGYNETLLFGALLIWLGHSLAREHMRSAWRWALAGLIGGLAWWTNGLIVVAALPVAGLLLFRLLRPAAADVPAGMRVRLLMLALVAFLVGSAPWWAYNLSNDWAALAFFTARSGDGALAGNAVPELPLAQRVLGLFVLGLPTVIGMRFPWEAAYFAPAAGALVLCLMAAALVHLAWRRPSPLLPDARALVLGMLALFCGVFVFSKFSIDPSGRYFLPLTLPLGIALGALVDGVVPSRVPRALVQAGILALVLGYYAAGQWVVARDPNQPGFTTQFSLASHIPNEDDAALIAWLDQHGIDRGYASYWVAFRIAFLTDERILLGASLLEAPRLFEVAHDLRYPPYNAAADASETGAYIVADRPEMRLRLEAAFAARGVRYEVAEVGVYRIYYNFSPAIPRPPFSLPAVSG